MAARMVPTTTRHDFRHVAARTVTYMEHFTAITRNTERVPTSQLPHELSLLTAPVVGKKPDKPSLGHAVGVLVNGAGRAASFIVRFDGGARDSQMVLVPIGAIEIGNVNDHADGVEGAEPVLRLLWTPDQLMAQPQFQLDGGLPTQDLLGHTPPAAGLFLPARPNVVPPGASINGVSALRSAVSAGAVAGIAGMAIGVFVTGPIGALALGAFFGLGGGIAGAIAGGSRDSAADASEFEAHLPENPAGMWPIRRLEEMLDGRALFDSGAIRCVALGASNESSVVEAGPPNARADRDARPHA